MCYYNITYHTNLKLVVNILTLQGTEESNYILSLNAVKFNINQFCKQEY